MTRLWGGIAVGRYRGDAHQRAQAQRPGPLVVASAAGSQEDC